MSRISVITDAKKLLNSLTNWRNFFFGATSKKIQGTEMNRAEEAKNSLTLPNAPSLPVYELLDDQAQGDDLFLEVKENVFSLINSINNELFSTGSTSIFFKESGRLSERRPYFYIKLSGEKGLLFERSGSGWIIAPAEKIAGRDLFLRNGEILDAVQIFTSPKTKRFRLSSQLLDLDQVGVPVYCERIKDLFLQQVEA